MELLLCLLLVLAVLCAGCFLGVLLEQLGAAVRWYVDHQPNAPLARLLVALTEEV